MSDSDLREYEQTQYNLMTKAMSMAYATLNESIEDLIYAIKRRCKDFEDMEGLNKKIGELRINIVKYFEQNTLLSVKTSGLDESELTISETAHSVPLPHSSFYLNNMTGAG